MKVGAPKVSARILLSSETFVHIIAQPGNYKSLPYETSTALVCISSIDDAFKGCVLMSKDGEAKNTASLLCERCPS